MQATDFPHTKRRESNFELLRITAILLVLAFHANFLALEGPNAEDITTAPVDSFLRILFQTIGAVCVDLFVMISGWFCIKPSKKSLANIFFQVGFYLTLIYIVAIIVGRASPSFVGFKELILATSSNWFIKAYLCLYIFAPALNFFAEHSKKHDYILVLVGFFAFQTVYGWIFHDSTEYLAGGYSPINFFGLYLLARYIRIHSPQWSSFTLRTDTLFYLSLVTITSVTCFLPTYIRLIYTPVYGYNLLTYISPTTILMSTSLIIITSKIHFKSNIINRIASSSFAVYLVYVSPWTLTPYKALFFNIHSNYQGIVYWLFVVLIIVVMYLIVTIIDETRKFCWRILSNRYLNS